MIVMESDTSVTVMASDTSVSCTCTVMIDSDTNWCDSSVVTPL